MKLFSHRQTSLTGLFLVGEVGAGMSWPDSCSDKVEEEKRDIMDRAGDSEGDLAATDSRLLAL